MRGNSRGRFRLTLALLAALILGALPAGIASPAFAAAAGSISGTVTVPAGVNVTSVDIYAQGKSFSETVRPDAAGQFTIQGLDADEYRLYFRSSGFSHLVIPSYYGGFKFEDATPIALAQGEVIAGIKHTMTPGGRIKGKVALPTGTNPGNVVVHAEVHGDHEADNDWSHLSDRDGNFELGPLAPGEYVVFFRQTFGSEPFVETHYPGVPSGDQATRIKVVDGLTTTGINQVLKQSALISGTLFSPTRFDGTVLARPINDLAKAAGRTDVKAGAYIIGGLEAGSYKLEFQSHDATYASMWHGGVAHPSAAPSLTLTGTQHIQGLTDTAVRGATIRGFADGDVNYPSVDVVNLDGTVANYVNTVRLLEPNEYAVSGLFPGTYKVQFNRYDHDSYRTAQEGQYYNALPEGAGLGSAAAITVAPGQTVSNINQARRIGGTLAGKLLGANGAPLKDAAVRVYTKDGVLVTRRATTAADGTFNVTGLTTGLYFVSAAPAGESGPIYSGNVLTEVNARSVSTFSGQNTDIGTLSYATASQGTRGFDDVPLGAQFEDEMQWLADKQISTGWESNGAKIYRPLTPVNRDAMAAFMYRLSGKPAFAAPTGSPFTDLPVGAQFYKEITWLADKGISTGWEEADQTKTYRPLQPVNRDAMAAFLYRLAGEPEFTPPTESPFIDVPVEAEFYKEITWLAAQGISTGWAESGNTKSFKPLLPVNRDAMAAFMFRYNTKFGSI
ncbi:carboxypeptidase regulatory-like domain-containing protein [Arthrobacter sp. D3-18]